MKPGTGIEVRGFDLSGNTRWEPAKIGRMRKEHGVPPAGFYPITYLADGAKLLGHENGFRVDNRALTLSPK